VRPTACLVEGAGGRRVGAYSPEELHEFKERIRESVRTVRGVPAGYEFEPPDRRLARETFTITPLDRDGDTCGEPETWRVE